jgi:hypothetical protein
MAFDQYQEKPGPKTTHEVFNGTNLATVSKHTSAQEAKDEADKLNGYHNTDHFSSRPVKEGEKLSKEKKDPSLDVAVGDGTQKPVFDPNKVENEQTEKVTPTGKLHETDKK